MRVIALLLASASILASGLDLSDVDVTSITKVTADFLGRPPLSISAPSVACARTAEAGCTLEVSVVGGPSDLIVSKIDGVWTVGRWQREIMAFQRCIAALSEKNAKEDAAGLSQDAAKRREERRACYGPTGQYGGMRGQ
jgi:hypothetical protein